MYDISVVICTYNRAEMLRDTLESWFQVKTAGHNAEVIIVDNNSKDHTQHVVESFQSACSDQLRYVYETNVGLSYARNRGIREAFGNIIAFVDDDVYFDKDWLNELIKAFGDNSDISCLGGKSTPIFEGEKPEWITEDILGIYGSTGSGEKDKLMSYPEFPFGLNMAFRKDVFTKVGKFNTELGRIKKSLLSNEEKEFFYRINIAGLKVFYSPKVVIYHRIPFNRMAKSWILKRIYWQAVSDVIFDQSIQKQSKFILFKKAIRSIKPLMIPVAKPTPRNLYVHYRSLSFKDKLVIYKNLGRFKQNLSEFFKPCVEKKNA